MLVMFFSRVVGQPDVMDNPADSTNYGEDISGHSLYVKGKAHPGTGRFNRSGRHEI